MKSVCTAALHILFSLSGHRNPVPHRKERFNRRLFWCCTPEYMPWIICAILSLCDVRGNAMPAQDSFPILQGKLVFHSYSSYESWDGKLFMLDFSDRTLTELGKNWNIDNTINAHFSPDGSFLTFMGDERGQPRDWDIFIWEVDSDKPPVNLTAKYNKRDEDPKFSPDGRKIVFKQSYWDDQSNRFKYDLKELNLHGDIINTITRDNDDEESMPFYTRNGSGILYSRGVGAGADIYSINIDGTGDRALARAVDIQEYYPIVRDESTFLYTRWFSADNTHDQIYMGYFSGATSLRLEINDANAENADPTPADSEYIFFSSTRSNPADDYDLYVSTVYTGEVWSLDSFGVNTKKKELGASYFSEEKTRVNVNTGSKSSANLFLQSYPNPFNPTTTIEYAVPEKCHVEIRIIDMLGREIRTLVTGERTADHHQITWNGLDNTGSPVSSGVYFYAMTAGGFTETRKLLLIR